MRRTGAELHRFTWLADERVGDLPLEWNWLETEYDENPNASLIHYTLGAPCFADYADTPQARYWHQEARHAFSAIGEPPAAIARRAEELGEPRAAVSER